MGTKQDKAVLLVAQGRVKVTHRDENRISGVVVGGGGEYTVEVNPEGQWCTCTHGQHRGNHADCSHVLAVKVETIRHSEHVQSR
jgi:predicted nucleic acid-binding Zn finger protein